MIMALIRLHANIHTLQQLQSYRQSKVQIEPAAVWYRWTLTLPPSHSPPCPKVQGHAISMHLDMWSRCFWYTHGSVSFAFVSIVLPPFALRCVLRMIGKHHHSLWAYVLHHHLPLLVLLWVEVSVHAGLEAAHYCITPGNYSQQMALTCYFLQTWLLEVTLLFPWFPSL